MKIVSFMDIEEERGTKVSLEGNGIADEHLNTLVCVTFDEKFETIFT